MADFSINDKELEALKGLPYAYCNIYLLGVRPYMNEKTGVSGEDGRLTYTSIANDVYVEKVQGRRDWGSLTKKQIKCAIEHLVKRGLIKRVGESDCLTFKCVFATLQDDESINAKDSP